MFETGRGNRDSLLWEPFDDLSWLLWPERGVGPGVFCRCSGYRRSDCAAAIAMENVRTYREDPARGRSVKTSRAPGTSIEPFGQADGVCGGRGISLSLHVGQGRAGVTDRTRSRGRAATIACKRAVGSANERAENPPACARVRARVAGGGPSMGLRAVMIRGEEGREVSCRPSAVADAHGGATARTGHVPRRGAKECGWWEAPPRAPRARARSWVRHGAASRQSTDRTKP